MMHIVTMQPPILDRPGVFGTKNFDSSCILELLRPIQPKVFIEIGLHLGDTADLILKNFSCVERYIGIDLPTVHTGYLDAAHRVALPYIGSHCKDPRLEIYTPHHGSLGMKLERLPNADAFYIDGNHTYDYVRHDSELARKLVTKGIIIWDDYNLHRDVITALDEDAKSRDIYHIKDSWIAYEPVP